MPREPTTRSGDLPGASGDAVLAPGRVFAGHEIKGEAGRGGMGVVYEAVHLRLQVTRALKVLGADAAGDPAAQARFERESQLAAGLEHPNIVPVYEAGEEDGLVFLSMRYVDGPDLSDLLAGRTRLEAEETVRLVEQVAAALDAAHERGLVHRDVKPANILLEGPGGDAHAFLGDFGISRLLGSEQDLTQTGEMLGTVNYVAPEQIAGESVDGRADVYSLACVAFEALAGQAPFERDTQLATMFAHANDRRPSLSAVRAGLPSAVDRVFHRALAIEPGRRYASAGEFAAELRRGVEGEKLDARTPRGAFGRRLPFLLGAAALTLAAVAALVLGGAFDGSETSPPPKRTNARAAPLPAPTARVVGTIDMAAQPSAIAVGELNVWTVSEGDSSLEAIVPATGDRAQQPVSVGGRPAGVAVGFGSIWAVDRASDALLRLDPGQGSVPVRIPVGDAPTDVAVSSTRLWVTNAAGGSVSRVDPTTNEVDATVSVAGDPVSVAAGEGGIWVAGGKSGLVTELEPEAATLRGSPVRVGGKLTSIAAGEAGVWVVDASGRRVVRISPGSRDVSPSVLPDDTPTTVTTAYGYAWVAFQSGRVTRIDPTELRPAGNTLRVGARPVGIAAGKGYVWTANEGDSTVTRIAATS